jgi:exonuclease III
VRKAVRLACRNSDGVRGRKLELEHFLSEHGTDIYLLRETQLEPVRALRFANYVFHRTDRPTRGGCTTILVSRGIDHYAVPVSGLQHLEATAINTVLANWPVKVVAVYLPPTRPLTKCLSEGSPVLIAGDLNAKHRHWNSRLTTARGSLLCDYINRNSC